MDDFVEAQEKRKKRWITFLQIFAVMVSSLHYWSLTKSVLPLVVCLFIFLPVVFKGLSIKIGTRTLVYTMVSTMVLSVLPYQFIKQTNVYFMLPGTFLVPFCIIGAAHLVLIEQKRIILSGFSTLIFLCYLIGGDLNTGRGFWRTSSAFTSNLKWNYLISFAVCLAAIFIMFRIFSLSRFVKPNPLGWKKFQARFICILAFCICFSLSPLLQKGSVPVLRQVENYFLTQLNHIGRYHRGGAKKYENENNINRPMHNKFGRDLGRIVMRVSGERPPALLRFYSYDTYENGIWMRNYDSKVSVREEEREDEEETALLVVENYILNPQKYADETQINTVYPTDFLSDKIIPVSYDSVGLALSLDTIDAFPDNSLIAKGLSQATGIRLMRSGFESDNAISKPRAMSKEIKKYYSSVPKDMENYLISRWQDMSPVTDDAKVAANNIAEYFLNNYRYDLDFVNTYYEEAYYYDDELIEKDIIQYFLESSYKAGHCELFASSTVLLLRAAGFQARYVSGSIVHEKSDGGDYMITRAKDLHAWVEVWDNKSKNWFVIDPTPSTDGVFPDFRPSGLEAFMENMTFKMKKIISYVLQGEITVAIAEAFFAVYNPAKEFLNDPFRGSLSFLAFVLFIVWRVKKYRNSLAKHKEDLTKDLKKARKLIASMANKYLPPPPQGNCDYFNICEIRQFLKGDQSLDKLSSQLLVYEQSRFGSELYSSENVNELKRAIKQAKGKLKRLKREILV